MNVMVVADSNGSQIPLRDRLMARQDIALAYRAILQFDDATATLALRQALHVLERQGLVWAWPFGAEVGEKASHHPDRDRSATDVTRRYASSLQPASRPPAIPPPAASGGKKKPGFIDMVTESYLSAVPTPLLSAVLREILSTPKTEQPFSNET